MKIQASSNNLLEKIDVARLPAIPDIPVAILETDDSMQTTCDQLGELAGQCPAFACDLLRLQGRIGNQRPSLTAAARRLERSGMRLLALARATRPAVPTLPDAQWRRALHAAFAARALATRTGLADPAEAYLAGLLQNVGELLLLAYAPEDYGALLGSVPDERQRLALELERYGTTHPDLGAELVERWALDSFLADAIRFHHQPRELLDGAHPLPRIAAAAAALVADEAATEAAGSLLGLDGDALRSVVAEAQAELKRSVAERSAAEGPPRPWDDPLADRVRNLALADVARGITTASGAERGLTGLQAAIGLLVGSHRGAFFQHDAESDRLVGAELGLELPRVRELAVRVDSQTSLLARCYRDRRLVCLDERGSAPPLAVLDRQVRRLLGADLLLCVPLDSPGARGVLVLALEAADAGRIENHAALIQRMAREFEVRPGQAPAAEGPEQGGRLRSLRHEINNPLSTVRNTLHVLRTQLGQDHAAAAHLEMIEQEVGRVAQLVEQIPGPDAVGDAAQPVDLNGLLQDWLRMSFEAMEGTSQIELKLRLDPDLPPLQTEPDAVKQVLLNLVRNAVEAMDGSGTLTVATRDFFKVDGTPGIELYIEDTGPGLPDTVRERLYEPVPTNKGGNHAGLGLSIVRKLVDRLDGSIRCESSSRGTSFRLMLPRKVPEDSPTTKRTNREDAP